VAPIAITAAFLRDNILISLAQTHDVTSCRKPPDMARRAQAKVNDRFFIRSSPLIFGPGKLTKSYGHSTEIERCLKANLGSLHFQDDSVLVL
jgi:hypothetical protein